MAHCRECAKAVRPANNMQVSLFQIFLVVFLLGNGAMQIDGLFEHIKFLSSELQRLFSLAALHRQ